MSQEMTQTDSDQKRADLFNWKDSEDAPDDALTARQLYRLKDGVRAAIENGDVGLGAPGDLSNEQWTHAGVGISLFMHSSGIVVMETDGETLVTEAETIDNMGMARMKFFAGPAPAFVATDDY